MSYSSSLVASLPAFTAVYVFGDSLLDPGNALKAAEFLGDLPFVSLPSGAPTAEKGYFEGRFSDGYNFADLVSNKLLLVPTKPTFPYGFEIPGIGLPIPLVNRPEGINLSFAYGGAQAIKGIAPIPDLDEQTDAYRNGAADPNALYLITIGGNDIRALVPTDHDPVVGTTASARLSAISAEIADEVAQLFRTGARHVLVTGIPDVGLVPEYTGTVGEAVRRSLATEYSQRLDSVLTTTLEGLSLPEGSNLYSFDFLGLSAAAFADPAAFRFTNLTQARTKVQAGALDPVGSGFLFFDPVHPSGQAHAIIAGEILDSFRTPQPAPDAFPGFQSGPRILGGVEGAGGVDTFTASLAAGRTYTFDLFGISSGSGSLADPRLRIFDSSGALIGEDDDQGLGLDAHLTFVAPSSGTFTVQVGGVGVVTGSYVLQGPDLRGSDVTIQGGSGDDTLGAVGGSNYLRGGDGDDLIVGGSGFDDINGNMGNDTCFGGAGGDWVVGGKDDDWLFGEGGEDIVFGNLGNDVCDGGGDADLVRGGKQDDVIVGGSGDDWLSGDMGNDTVTGGAGADVFHTFGEAGLDLVVDFDRSDGDSVQVDPGTQYVVSQVGADTVISMTGGGQMVLVGVSTSELTGAWIFGA